MTAFFDRNPNGGTSLPHLLEELMARCKTKRCTDVDMTRTSLGIRFGDAGVTFHKVDDRGQVLVYGGHISGLVGRLCRRVWVSTKGGDVVVNLAFSKGYRIEARCCRVGAAKVLDLEIDPQQAGRN